MMNRVFLFLTVVSLLFTTNTWAQRKTPPTVKDTLSGQAFIRMLDQSLSLYYDDFTKDGRTDSIIDALNYDAETAPVFSDEVYCERLAKMNEFSTFHYDCNATSLSMVKFFAANRRNFAKVVLGRSKLYFDLYEEKLAEYGLPLELKYLSVIESGLRPQVKSRAGALGLWQFMYGTGKQYGLTENSYIDERMDPAKATDAACRYLKKLYDIYGDWNLALAAYNAGPGNVNKAIKRSGGKRTYWEVRPFLPSETQGYVPNFIAASYLLTYHAEHNITAADAKIHYYKLDTMCLKRGIHMQTVEKLISWSVDDIQSLNPVYKTAYIPKTEPRQCITGPLEKIGLLVSLEDSLYQLEVQIYGQGGNVPININPANPVNTTIISSGGNGSNNGSNANNGTKPPVEVPVVNYTYIYHKVKKGENLGKIAAMYSVTVDDIVKWNNLPSTAVNLGALLKIQQKQTTTVEGPNVPDRQVDISNDVPADTSTIETPEVKDDPTPPTVKVQKKYYTVRSGDTYGKIAGKYGLTVAQLQRLNPGVKANRIQPGQRIRVK